MKKRNSLLHLSLIEGIGPATIVKLYKVLESIHSWNIRDFQAYGMSAAVAALIVQGLQQAKLLEDELNLIDKYSVQLITLLDKEYPPLLKAIYAPPPVLYVAGNVSLTHPKMLAVVGSRASDAYGMSTARKLVEPLAQQGWTIVSGGALGIDGVAHNAALSVQGKTIAVFGSGLLRPYPARHKELFRRIVDQGALVSCFPLNTEPKPGLFPARNRIIAGLAKACLVVQAAQKSGALITASFALNEGREVLAVPGAIDNPLSMGCHKLIQDGAQVVTCSEDVSRLLSCHEGFTQV